MGLPSVGAVEATGAWLGGVVQHDGGVPVTEYGVVASMEAVNPDPWPGGVGVRKVSATGSQQAFSLRVNELSPGRRHVFRAYARNVKGVSYSEIRTFSTTGQNAQQDWRMLHFGTTANAGQAADAADPDADGLSNAREFALALNPKRWSPNGVESTLNGARLELKYRRGTVAQRDGTSVQAEWSADLVDWSREGVEETLQSDDGTHQLVKAVMDAGTAVRRFVRIRVVVPAE
jgi:hypothetical protein